MPRIGPTILFLALLLSACSRPVARPRVHGTVSLGGTPVGSQTLTLFHEGSDNERYAQNIPIGPDGTFSGEVPAPGLYKVLIQPSMAAMEGNAPPDAKTIAIPAKYRDRTTSGLEWDIKPGDNERTFELK